MIVTLTMNPTIDINTGSERVVPERKLRCERPILEPGGGGINVSRAINKLGGQSRAIFPKGGPPGQLLENLLKAENLDFKTAPIEGMTRENFSIMDRSSDQLFRFVLPGPELSETELQSVLKLLHQNQPDILVLSGSLPAGVDDHFYSRIVSSFADQNVKIIVDTKGQALKHAADEGVFLLKPNIHELSELAEKELHDECDQEKAAMELIKKQKTQHVVVSLGAAGIMFVSDDKCIRLRAPNVAVKSRVGAGDSMVAGITLALSRGFEILDAVKFGVASGTAAVMTPGTELCTKEDTERLFEQIEHWQI